MEISKQSGRTWFVSFSGVDGAGKSTQIRALSASLSQLGLRVRVISFWDEVARLTGLRENAGHKIFKGQKGIGTPSAPVERRDKNVRSLPMTCFRFLLYLLDAFSLRAMCTKLKRSELDVVIFDRYIYDELANLNLDNPAVRAYASSILKLTPSPDLSLLLDADPVQARARKPEYPIDFIHINRQSYKDLSRIATEMRCLPPMSIDGAHRAILGYTLDALSRSVLVRAPFELPVV
jgi:thymidylate kinase